MKRRREYMPRGGMRFDRKHVQGGDAGFIGGDVEVVTITGSVSPVTTQLEGTFKYKSVPFAGYPRTPGEMQLAFGGKGTWVDGYLLEESDSALTSSFDSTHILTGSNTDRVAFRIPGFRGPADDYALTFASSGTVGNVANFIPTGVIAGTGTYGLTATADVGLLWVGRGLDYIDPFSSFGYMFSQGNGSSGWVVEFAGAGSSGSFAIQTEIYSVGITRLNTRVAVDSRSRSEWFVGLLAFERGVGKMTFAVIDLGTRAVDSVYRDISSLGDASGPGANGGFKFGGAFLSSQPAAQTVSAFYIASGTNAMSGVFGNENTLLQSFANIITAKNGYLFTGSNVVQNSAATFGHASNSTFLNQKLLGLGTASLGRSRGYVSITTGTQPSWTNVHLGHNSAFVSFILSSSDHESQVLNYYRSGSELLESTAVPASAKLYYVKTGSYSGNTLTKKKGTSNGLVLLTGSAVNGEFALAYRLTGSLANLSGTTPGWLLNNEFGMPWIPLSSASLIDFVVEPVVSIHPQDILTVRPTLDNAQRLQDAARDVSPPQTRAQYAAVVVTSSLI